MGLVKDISEHRTKNSHRFYALASASANINTEYAVASPLSFAGQAVQSDYVA